MKRDDNPLSVIKKFDIFFKILFEPIFIFSDKLYGANLLKVRII